MKTSRLAIAAAAALALSWSSFGAAEWRHGERQALWPEGKIPDFQPHQIGAMTDETHVGSPWKGPKNAAFKPEEHRMPYIEWFEKPANPNGACMILVSGGSYQNCCDVNLIKKWRDCFTALGYQTVNLVYRTPRAKGLACYQSAWEDGQRAVRLVRSQAAATVKILDIESFYRTGSYTDDGFHLSVAGNQELSRRLDAVIEDFWP